MAIEEKSKNRFQKVIELKFSRDPKLKKTLDSYLELEEVESNIFQKIVFIVGNYHDRLSSYRFVDNLSYTQKEEYKSLRLLRMAIVNHEVGYAELKNHIQKTKKLC